MAANADVQAVDASASNSNLDYEDEERSTWSGRVTFWLAAVGSAVGLGNLWRFPWQCATWGGGAFIFAYFVALFTLGMPILTQELSLGQKHRSGDIEAFGRMNWRLRGIGLASVIGTFFIVTYYMMIIGLSTVFFFESFKVPLPYSGDDGANYWTTVLDIAPDVDQSAGIISAKLYLAVCFCWLMTFLCIMKGVKSASWAVKITMPLPFLLLFILLIKGATLEGSWKGVKEYWNFTNWDELSGTGIWNAAIGQCFFSLSVCMGVMTAYGSYNPKRQDIATDEKVISFLDVSASLMSGFVVYSVLGYLVVTTGDESWFDQASVGLVFAAYPVAIASFDGANFFGVCFYLTLILLGIDSAFSMVEAITTVIADSDLNLYKLHWSRTKISAVLCVIGAFVSSLYCFDTGLYWLDIVDHYINNYGMVFLGICETAACGWFYRYDIIENQIGANSANLYRLGFFISLLMSVFLSFALASPEGNDDDGYEFTGTLGADSWIVGFIVGLILWFISILWAYFNRNDYARNNLSFGATMWYIMGWQNVEILRDFMNKNGLGDTAWDNSKHTWYGELYAGIHHSSIGIWWGFFIKYWIPVVLTINLCGTMRENRWNPYGGYSWDYLFVGVLIFSSMVIVVAVVAIFPQWMTQTVDKSNKYQNVDLSKQNLLDDGDDAAADKQEQRKKQTMEEIYDSYDVADDVKDDDADGTKTKTTVIKVEEIKQEQKPQNKASKNNEIELQEVKPKKQETQKQDDDDNEEKEKEKDDDNDDDKKEKKDKKNYHE